MKNYLVLIPLALLLFSCKKDKDNDTPAALSAFDYMPLDSGNYWIYQWYEVDSNGNATPSNTFSNDTVKALGDTVINGLVFARVSSKGVLSANYGIGYFRDSSGVLVNHWGDILFSHSNKIIDTLSYRCDAVSYICRLDIRDFNEHPVTVPAGTFNVIENRLQVIDMTGAVLCTGTNYRTMTTTISKGIGKITSNTFYSNDQFCKYFEARLIKYYVK